MNTNQELKYRTLDELISSASVDLRAIYSDGLIEVAELIKIAQKCNYKLGLQINQTKETVLDVDHGHIKLPSDFNFLNFAYMCHHHEVIIRDSDASLVKKEEVFSLIPAVPPSLTTCPCQSVTVTSKIAGVQVTIAATVTDGFGNISTVNFSSNSDGSANTTKLCALSVIREPLQNVFETFEVSSSSFCYNDTNTGLLTCNMPSCNTCPEPEAKGCDVPDYDPWNQNKVYTICDGTIGIKVVQECRNEIRHYHHTEPIYMQPCRQASAFSSNSDFKMTGNIGILRNGFLEVSDGHKHKNRGFYIEEGRDVCSTVYLNYQGMMENEQGELLVLDHPLINDYYEYCIKYRILFNLYINGEVDIERRLEAVRREMVNYEKEAMNIAYTPNFNIVKETYRRERQIQNEKHFAPFSRWAGWNRISAEFDYAVNGRYRE